MVRTVPASTPSLVSTSRNDEPAGSEPTQPTIDTWAPKRAAVTAWFRPLPPGTEM